ncbi:MULTISPECIES: redoxin domain-containing protein [unclassified Arcicella]|uniref:redoxin domain-containing protein n=1 Tax=unclassified Arcicella TaxID=2644986 RepID=UPI002854369E|nr:MULTISPECIES: redoxin domain-containing protein [unclassified Arcicella]MDR6562034.1 peroxiredoxin [Arcicella sp. BE51]MDR6811906.1 peroxiredoxin [Arcicella sp. BE140]MDR6822936.1 peroxiredoxin [Arcicella sp. BE139]
MQAYDQSNAIIWDSTFPVNIFKGNTAKLSPLKIGSRLPLLPISSVCGFWKHFSEEVNTQKLTLQQVQQNKPLVISFLSGGWNEYGLKHFNTLKASYQEILALGGDLLVVVQASKEETKELVEYFNLPFNVIADSANQIAKQFGIYSQEFAVWDRIAGISEDVPVPATYVISQQGRIVYDAIDEDFSKPFSPSEMLGAVFSAARNIPYSIKYRAVA